MNKIEEIIKNSKVTLSDIQRNLDNLLEEKHFQPRADLKDLKEFSKDLLTKKIYPRMIGLSGLRGTGKTTLLWQTAKYIYENNYNRDIYFFNVERIIKTGINIFDISETIRKMPEFEKRTVMLFDEVHEDEGWSKSIKILYDSNRAFIICTGSSALLLQTTADLATRMYILHTYPLQFTEYVTISKNKQIENETEIKDSLKSALFFSKNIDEFKDKITKIIPQITEFYSSLKNPDELILKYIKIHNITRFTKINNQKVVIQEIEKLFRRVITEDIPKIIRKNYTYKSSEKLLLRLAGSDEINLQTLSQALGISADEIIENLEILENAELLNILLPFGGYDTKINKNKKAFFMSPSVRLALHSKMFEENKQLYSKLYEDIVVMYLRRFYNNAMLSFSSQKKGKNPDFVIETLPDPILIEVGTNKKSIKQITESNIKYRYGIIINAEANEIKYEKDIAIIPLKWFLLL
ncbi:MAG: AAA family ATPase [Bacteroidota bacterium]|nr:AAA family ATPase [Bacteroidota bacterium]